MSAVNLWAAWIGIAAGMASGAVMGLFFDREGWLGGYGTWPRRLLRLGHVSFFGLAFLNLAYAATVGLVGEPAAGTLISWLLVAGAVLMPATCALAAWRKPFRHLFFIPVLTLASATGLLINGGLSA